MRSATKMSSEVNIGMIRVIAGLTDMSVHRGLEFKILAYSLGFLPTDVIAFAFRF